MIRTSAYPTVEWLASKGAHSIIPASHEGPASVQHSEAIPPRTRRTSVNRLALSVFQMLRTWAKLDTSVARDIWIRTPNGEDLIDIVIEHKHRRIGIRFTAPFESGSDESDALVLVYGKFDALYRITPSVSASTARTGANLSYSIVSVHPSWFTSVGRVSAGRVADAEALLYSDELATKGQLHLSDSFVKRIRLSRASDWVRDFENALSPPKLITYAGVRSPHPRR